MKKIMFYPAIVDCADDLIDYYYRALWYLNPFIDNIKRITFITNIDIHQIKQPPHYLDQSIANFREKFSEKIEFVSTINHDLISQRLKVVNCVFGILSREDILEDIKKKYYLDLPSTVKIYFIDHNKSQFAGSFMLKIGLEVFNKEKEYVEISRNRFKVLKNSVPKGPIYLFGTGPSLKSIMNMDLSDGTAFACNSMVKNHALMDKLNPPVIIVGDPIFHAGCSSYAADFREELFKCIDLYDSWLVVPMRDMHIFLNNIPRRFSDKIIGISFRNGHSVRYDFTNELAVTTTSNILTLFLLPLAAYFSNDIRVGGCDGRPLKENNYFWKHDSSSQFVDKMETIKQAHPAFFNIDYNDYYQTHCDTLEQWCKSIEDRGKVITNFTHSYIPALVKRKLSIKKGMTITPDISVIMPCYNNILYIKQALESILCRDLSVEIILIDDHSDYYVSNFLNFLASIDPRIRLVENWYEKGVSNSRNLGLDLASGQFITFLDSDDFYDEVSLEQRAIALRDNKEWNIVHCETRVVGPQGQDMDWQFGRRKVINYEDVLKGNPFHLNSLMIRRSFIDNRRFREGLTNGEDWLFIANLLAKGEKSHLVEGYSAYRFHFESTVQKNFIEHEVVVEGVCEELFSGRLSYSTIPSKLLYQATSEMKQAMLLRRWISAMTWSILVEDSKSLEISTNKVLTMLKFEETVKEDIFRAPIKRTIQRYFGRSWNEAFHLLSFIKASINSCLALVTDHKLATYKAYFNDLVHSASKAYKTDSIAGPFSRENTITCNEVLIVKEVLRELGKNGIMIDVGAHYGGSFRHFLNQGWFVYAFEPDDRNRHKLLEKIKPNDMWYIDDRAVSNISGEVVPFYCSEESTGISGLSAFLESHKKVKNVTTITLRDIIEDKKIENVDFLKIDTEGYDYFVLQGFPWERIKPRVILCEYEDKKSLPLGYRTESLCRYIADKGYTVFISEWHPIVRYGIQHQWRQLIRYPNCYADKDGWGNLIAFRNSMDAARMIKLVCGNQTGLSGNFKNVLPFVNDRKIFFYKGITFTESVLKNKNTYTLSNKKRDNYICCVYDGKVYSKDTLKAYLDLLINKDCTLWVRLCRDGITPFESSGKKVFLKKGRHSITISHRFINDHDGARIQISVEDRKVSISEIYSKIKRSTDEVAEKANFNLNIESNSKMISLKKTTSQPIASINDLDLCFLIIIGNGSSMRLFDFNFLKGFNVIGMNAACRHWKSTGLYPKYYTCLDTVVIESLKDEIYELIQKRHENGIQLFFLRKKLLDFYPELNNFPEVAFFEDYFNSPYFDGITSKLTTGSFSALLAAMLGYKCIYLLGIDLNYVQQIPEAKNVKGHVLEMTQTPSKNPNYFFDDYQRKGDRFHVPDAVPNLHYQSWVIVKERLKRFGVHVLNCNPNSRLDIFDYADINEVLPLLTNR